MASNGALCAAVRDVVREPEERHMVGTDNTARRRKRRTAGEGWDEPSPRHGTSRLHRLFPRPRGAPLEEREICWIGIQRKLPPAEAERTGRSYESCPNVLPAHEITDWEAIHQRFGGGEYRVCAKDSRHRFIRWAAGDGDGDGEAWRYMPGRSKPLSEDEGDDLDDDLDVPVPASAGSASCAGAPVAPAADPGMSTLSAMVQSQARMDADAAFQMMQMQAEATSRCMEMMLKMNESKIALVIALLKREQHREVAPPQTSRLLDAVRLGMEIGLANAQPIAAPLTATQANPMAQLHGTIALMKEAGLLAPPRPPAGSDASEMAVFIDKLSADIKAHATPGMQAPPQAAPVLINGRTLTLDEAAAEYARLMNASPAPAAAPSAMPTFGAGPQTPTVLAAPLIVAEPPHAAVPMAPVGTAPPSISRRESAADAGAPDSAASLKSVLDELIAKVLINSVAQAPANTAHAPARSAEIVRSGDTTGIVADAEPPEAAAVAGVDRAAQDGHQDAAAVPEVDAGDRATVDRFLRDDPAAHGWLRAVIATAPGAPLPVPPADLGYFAEAVEFIGHHPDGAAMLCDVLERAGCEEPVSLHVALPPLSEPEQCRRRQQR